MNIACPEAVLSASLSNRRPTLLCSGRRWRGPWAGRDFETWWRATSHAGLGGSPAAPLKAGVGPPNNRYLHLKVAEMQRPLFRFEYDL